MAGSGADLLTVLDEVKALLSMPGNDYTWSSFQDAEAAIAEIDAYAEAVRAGVRPAVLTVLFAATGPIQEVAISSGWGDEFLAVAGRFDAAMLTLP